MSRSDIPATNKKSVKCLDCGKWVTLQGYAGHQRFYHGKYQKELEERLFQRLLALRSAGKISAEQLGMLAPLVGGYHKPTMEELEDLKNTIDAFWLR